ncbi:MAG: hypothetical protein AB9869_30715 [Verrucomicrobiia bacterium]
MIAEPKDKLDSIVAAREPPDQVTHEPRSGESGSTFRGVLWCEWFAHSRLLLAFLLFWLACVWFLPLVSHSGWIVVVAAAFALVAGPVYGGGDTIEGCEEFSFSLPATRAERYLARLVIGGGALLLFTVLDLLTLGLDLPQFLGRLYLDTGLLKPLPVLKPRLLYGLVLAFPLAVFAFSFALAAVSHSRMLILTAWFWSLLVAMSVTQLAFWYENAVWGELNGFCSGPLLMLLALAALWGGYRAYLQKEIGHHHQPLTLPPRFWLWLLMLGIGIALACVLISLLVRQYPNLLAVTD